MQQNRSISVDVLSLLDPGDGIMREARVYGLTRDDAGVCGVRFRDVAGGRDHEVALRHLSVSSVIRLVSSLSSDRAGLMGPFSGRQLGQSRGRLEEACVALAAAEGMSFTSAVGPDWHDRLVERAGKAVDEAVRYGDRDVLASRGPALKKLSACLDDVYVSLEEWIGQSMGEDLGVSAAMVREAPAEASAEVMQSGKENGFLDGIPVGELSSPVYESYAAFAQGLAMDMSYAAGWRGHHRPMKMDGFDGFLLKEAGDGIALLDGGRTVGTVRPQEGGGVILDGFADQPAVRRAASDAQVMSVLRELCMSPENVSRLRERFHCGREMVFALRMGSSVLFGVERGDRNLVRGLVAGCREARFVSPEELSKIYDVYLERLLKTGTEKGLPVMERYLYDGLSVSTEKELDVDGSRSRETIQSDLELMMQVKDRMDGFVERVRREVGVPEGDVYRFRDAVCPVMVLRDDVLAVMCGRSLDDSVFATVRNGEMLTYGGYDPHTGRLTSFEDRQSVAAFLNIAENVILSDHNIGMARDEYSETLTARRSAGRRI